MQEVRQVRVRRRRQRHRLEVALEASGPDFHARIRRDQQLHAGDFRVMIPDQGAGLHIMRGGTDDGYQALDRRRRADVVDAGLDEHDIAVQGDADELIRSGVLCVALVNDETKHRRELGDRSRIRAIGRADVLRQPDTEEGAVGVVDTLGQILSRGWEIRPGRPRGIRREQMQTEAGVVTVGPLVVENHLVRARHGRQILSDLATALEGVESAAAVTGRKAPAALRVGYAAIGHREVHLAERRYLYVHRAAELVRRARLAGKILAVHIDNGVGVVTAGPGIGNRDGHRIRREPRIRSPLEILDADVADTTLILDLDARDAALGPPPG